MTPSLATSDRADVILRRAAQLATLGQGLPVDESVRPRGQEAGVGQREWSMQRFRYSPWPWTVWARLRPSLTFLSATRVASADKNAWGIN